MKMRVMIDSFSGSLGDLPRGRRTVAEAVRVLAKDPRVSTFERGGWIEGLIAELLDQGLAIEDKTVPYPWHKFNLTEKGRAMMPAKETT